VKALVFALLVVLCATGCATVRTLDAAKPGAPVVYSGTRLDLYAMQGGCCAQDRFGAEAPAYPGLDLPRRLGGTDCVTVRALDAAKPGAYPGLDLPGSMVLDTVLLPLSVLTVLGVGFQASGGL
jgi:uncharacterized protein YceK